MLVFSIPVLVIDLMVVVVYLPKQVPIEKKLNLIIIQIKYNLTLLIGAVDDTSVFEIVLKT